MEIKVQFDRVKPKRPILLEEDYGKAENLAASKRKKLKKEKLWTPEQMTKRIKKWFIGLYKKNK